jgi:hypothetical protein
MLSKNIKDHIITDLWFDNRIKCKRCYATFSQTEYYKQSIVNKISDAYNGEYDRDLEAELSYFIKQINLQCNHFIKCVIM